ncbi:MAG: hypothetical protein KJN89_02200 [Gammaproteobacteria bacterium]|nr:hypothetical protein [Gammaproteobacteria bacterium]MBT8132877.1 hypothetical protein [Gammaproteobacteria bacterium]NNJ49159.1 hypothetical protein [Gammaproteobacteria bacterium]
MKNIKQKMAAGLMIFVMAMMTSVEAYAEGAIRFSNNAFKQVISKSADGSTTFDYVEPGLVLPDDVILYEIVFENISDQEVSNIVVNNPIANNSTYRDRSATGDSTTITFSVDGENFASADALTVKDKTGKIWKAKPEDYKAIRWIYTKPLKPGEKGKVTYKTTIK